MQPELPSITKACCKLNTEKSYLEDNSDNRKTCIQKPPHATSPLPRGTEARAAGQSRFRIPNSLPSKWQLWPQHWQQRTPQQFTQQREIGKSQEATHNYKFPSDHCYSTTTLTSNYKPSHFRKPNLSTSSWMFITFKQEGEKNKKININETVQIDHFFLWTWVSLITQKALKL